MKIDNDRAKTIVYLLLLAIQIGGAITFVWQQLPEFEQILLRPGEQLPKDPVSDLAISGIFSAMQISFWCRLLYVPIPFRRPNVFLNHLFLFLGRLSFIFGSALFSVVVFRHLPEMARDTDILLIVQRGASSWDACSRCFAPVWRLNDWPRRLTALAIELPAFSPLTRPRRSNCSRQPQRCPPSAENVHEFRAAASAGKLVLAKFQLSAKMMSGTPGTIQVFRSALRLS
jgi:hypothetical protein